MSAHTMHTSRSLAAAIITSTIAAAALTGCTSNAHTFDRAQAMSGGVLEEIIIATRDLGREDIDEETRLARLRYLAAVRDRVVEIDGIRLGLMLDPYTPAQRRVVEQALQTVYNHALFLARFPGELDTQGRPSDPETAAILGENIFESLTLDFPE